jgi:hypothetical protein
MKSYRLTLLRNIQSIKDHTKFDRQNMKEKKKEADFEIQMMVMRIK